jgi:hypothetical protein
MLTINDGLVHLCHDVAICTLCSNLNLDYYMEAAYITAEGVATCLSCLYKQNMLYGRKINFVYCSAKYKRRV